MQQDVTIQRQASLGTVSPVLPLFAALAAAASLVGLYLGLVTWAQGFGHARDLLWDDRYFVAAVASGFGVQAGLYVYLRRLLSLRARGSAAAGTVAGTGTSTAAMLACCAHHVTDPLPLLGLSGVAIFLGDYRVQLMSAGIAVNGAGVIFMLWLVFKERRQLKAEPCPAVP
ncbi:MAG TPA: hypothetical protein VLS25_04740 [Dehalococcoidia bacterium]|nr:hypothetical protein [Dehalococcoidia bacterium]